MDNYIIYFSHSCMYERGSIRVLEGVIELRMRPLLAQGCKRTGPRFFIKVDQRGCGCRCRWLMQVVIASIR